MSTITRPTIPEGTYEMTGYIKALWYRERRGAPFGAARRSHAVMIVAFEEGGAVIGTVPRSIERALIPLLYEHRDVCANLCELASGAWLKVRLTATVTRLDDDTSFGYFRQPKNAALIAD